MLLWMRRALVAAVSIAGLCAFAPAVAQAEFGASNFDTPVDPGLAYARLTPEAKAQAQAMVTNHLPVAVRRIVAVFGVPSRGR